MVFVLAHTNAKVNRDLHLLSILTLSFDKQGSGVFATARWLDSQSPSCAIRIYSRGGSQSQDKKLLGRHTAHLLYEAFQEQPEV